MMNIYIENLKLFAYHGLYEEEKLLGNVFILNLKIEVSMPAPITNLSQSVDYTKAVTLIKSVFSKRENLLENLCYRINQKLLSEFQIISAVNISIQKEVMPVENFNGNIKVELKSIR